MENAMKKAIEITRGRTFSGTDSRQYCVLAQEDLDGRITAAVITAAKADGIKHIYLCSGINSNWAQRAKRDNRAALCFESDEYCITLRGSLEILTDEKSKQENWYDGLENHFSGADDPNYCVMRFTAEVYKLFIDWEETEGSL
jgi:general stress protein 26